MKIQKLRAVHDAVLTVQGINESLGNMIANALKFTNPAYAAAARFTTHRFVSADVPEHVVYGWMFEDELTMYRGSVSMLPSRFQKLVRKNIRWKDNRNFKPVDFPDLQLDLNDEQQICMKALETAITTKSRPFGNYLVIASTSVGKTILQSAMAHRFGQKTLVLCPTELIQRAWVEDLQKLFGFTPKQIGLIRQKKWVEGDVFTIASVATLGRRREVWDEINHEFGTIVVDEVQGVSSDTYFSFLSQSPAAYLIGATATQEARDGSVDYNVKALFGPPIVEVNTYHKETKTSLCISEVKLVNTSFKYVHQADNIDWNDLSMELAADETRNSLILSNVKKEWLDNRVVLIVAKRVEHVKLLHDMALEMGISNANVLTGETNTDKFYTSKLLESVRSRKVTCVIATIQAIKVGANVPTLDSLHIAAPPANRRDLEQLVGRIRRKANDKHEATVTYYFDRKVPYMLRLFKKVVVPTFRKLEVPGYKNMFVV